MDILFRTLRAAIAVALVIMVIVTSIEVVRRYIFSLSFVWAEELVKFLLVAVTFLGGAVAYRAKGLAYLDLLTSKLSKKKKQVMDTINSIITIVFCIYFSIQGYAYTFSPVVTKMTSTGLKLNMSFIYITIPLGFTFICIFTLESMLKTSGMERITSERGDNK